MKEQLDTIGRLLTDCSVNFIEAENDDEGWIEGLRYALGVVDIKKAVFSIKEKK